MTFDYGDQADYSSERLVPPPIWDSIKPHLKGWLSRRDAARRASKGRFLAGLGLVLGFLVGVNALWTSKPPTFATVTLLPTEDSGFYLGTENRLKMLAGLSGLPSGPVPKFTRFVSSLYTTGVAELMDRKYDMICRTYAGNCDRTTHRWKKGEGFDAWWDRTMAQLGHLRSPDEPRTASDLAQYTRSSVNLTSNEATHIVSLTMDSHDPTFERFYLKALVSAADDYVKAQDRSAIQQYVKYLNGKLATTTNIYERDSMNGLILDQERRLMLTSVDVPYAASIMDGPNFSYPIPPFLLVLIDTVVGAIMGAMLGFLIGFIPEDSAWRRPIWRRPEAIRTSEN